MSAPDAPAPRRSETGATGSGEAGPLPPSDAAPDPPPLVTPDGLTDAAPPDGSTAAPAPGDRAPDGRGLEVAPSTRYAASDPQTVASDGTSPLRGVLFGVLVALFVGLIMVLLGSVLGLTAGLLVAAFFLGQLTAVGVRAGAGASQGQTARAWTAVLLALGALLLVQVGLWLWARAEGGTLGPLDYLREVFGALVAIEAVLVAVGAWWGSR